jgi:hypothetical protein
MLEHILINYINLLKTFKIKCNRYQTNFNQKSNKLKTKLSNSKIPENLIMKC